MKEKLYLMVISKKKKHKKENNMLPNIIVSCLSLEYLQPQTMASMPTDSISGKTGSYMPHVESPPSGRYQRY